MGQSRGYSWLYMSTCLLPCARPVTVTIDLLGGVRFSGCIFSVGLKVSLGCSLQGLVSSVYVMDGTYNSHGIQCTSGYVPSLSNLAPVRSAPDKRWVDKKTVWSEATHSVRPSSRSNRLLPYVSYLSENVSTRRASYFPPSKCPSYFPLIKLT